MPNERLKKKAQLTTAKLIRARHISTIKIIYFQLLQPTIGWKINSNYMRMLSKILLLKIFMKTCFNFRVLAFFGKVFQFYGFREISETMADGELVSSAKS